MVQKVKKTKKPVKKSAATRSLELLLEERLDYYKSLTTEQGNKIISLKKVCSGLHDEIDMLQQEMTKLHAKLLAQNPSTFYRDKIVLVMSENDDLRHEISNLKRQLEGHEEQPGNDFWLPMTWLGEK